MFYQLDTLFCLCIVLNVPTITVPINMVSACCVKGMLSVQVVDLQYKNLHCQKPKEAAPPCVVGNVWGRTVRRAACACACAV